MSSNPIESSKIVRLLQKILSGDVDVNDQAKMCGCSTQSPWQKNFRTKVNRIKQEMYPVESEKKIQTIVETCFYCNY